MFISKYNSIKRWDPQRFYLSCVPTLFCRPLVVLGLSLKTHRLLKDLHLVLDLLHGLFKVSNLFKEIFLLGIIF